MIINLKEKKSISRRRIEKLIKAFELETGHSFSYNHNYYGAIMYGNKLEDISAGQGEFFDNPPSDYLPELLEKYNNYRYIAWNIPGVCYFLVNESEVITKTIRDTDRHNLRNFINDYFA